MGTTHTKEVRNTPFCQSLYNSSIANDPDNNDPRIILWILSLVGALIVLFFWLWIRRRDRQFESGNVDQANKSFLYIYKFLIYIYISIVAVQTALMTLEISLIYIGVEYSNFFISLIQSLILTIPHFQMAIIAFLFTKNTLSTKAFTRALKITIPYALLTFIVSLLDERSWLTSVSNDKISTSAILRVVIDLMFECACMFIVCRQCQYSWKRKNVILRYLLVVMIITGFDFVAQIFQSGKADGNCITQIGFYAWYIIYPLVFFKTIQDDSDYHWVYASKPLIESTAKSIADLDLFSLPGYHGVHFESTEDKKFRFKKLKQMVSGYVPIIPFNKIKFDNLNDDHDIGSTISSNSSPSRSSRSSPSRSSRSNNNTNNKTKRDNQTIGAGSTSKVYRGMYKQQPVAVKCLSRLDKKTDMSWTDLTLIFRESILSSSLSHPNVVKFLGASLTYNGFFLVYEYCAYGDLQQILVENSHPEEPKLSSIPQRLFYLLDISEGMKFLHKSGFVHRDLKTANVVVNYSKKNKRFVGKICDFGVSRQLPQEQEERMSRNAMAHDRFNKSLSTYSDVGSFADDNSTVLSVGNGSNLTVNSNGIQSVNTIGSGYGIQTFTPSQAGVGATTLLHGNNPNLNLNANALSEKHKQWQRFATRGNTKEITRTIHVGTPAFLAPEILLKLVKSKGVDLEKERKKQKKREKKRMQEKLKRRKERERKRREKESKDKSSIDATSIQNATTRALNDIDEEKENINNAEEHSSDDDKAVSAPHHYVRGAILDHNIDPHIYCDFSTDVYSFGMILWSIVTSKLPYKGFKPMDMILMIKNAQRLSISDKEWKKWSSCREIDIDVEKLQDLLEQCWAQYPYQRPSFEQIGDILTNIITDSHRKHSNLPQMVVDPESLMTNNTSINNHNIDRHRHDTT